MFKQMLVCNEKMRVVELLRSYYAHVTAPIKVCRECTSSTSSLPSFPRHWVLQTCIFLHSSKNIFSDILPRSTAASAPLRLGLHHAGAGRPQWCCVEAGGWEPWSPLCWHVWWKCLGVTVKIFRTVWHWHLTGQDIPSMSPYIFWKSCLYSCSHKLICLC